MKIPLVIFFLTIFSLSTLTGKAQVAPSGEKTKNAGTEKAEQVKDSKKDIPDLADNKQDQDNGDKAGSVKQVKSNRPDMSRSRGARPPDIVRPSGSRIPKGVGRPAGAGRHGRR